MTTAADIAKVKTGSTFADIAYDPSKAPPAGFIRTTDNVAINAANASGSGYQSNVYFNATTRQMWIAVAGSNDMNDVKSWIQ
jgi:hypothetical protein